MKMTNEKTEEKSFSGFAEETRARLRKRGTYGSSSDLYINEKQKIAIIGVQTSQGGSGHDTIYLLRAGGELEEILDRTFRSGRMFPTGISEDGKKAFYTIKDESGEFHNKDYEIK